MPDLPPMQDARLAVVGLARNLAHSLPATLTHLCTVLNGFAHVQWLIVESDSTDGTGETLARLECEIENFTVLSLGALSGRIPERTERIAACRNRALEHLEQDPRYARTDFVLVVDLDGVTDRLTHAALTTCWETRTDWAMVSANQDGPYYDVWALRHPLWCPNDCQQVQDWLQALTGERVRNRERAKYDRMIRVPQDAEWIEVESAFGGLAIYRWDALRGCRYAGRRQDGSTICEHVALHEQMRAQGHRLFINPRLINTGHTQHSRKLRRRHAVPRALRLAWLALTRQG